MKSIVFISISVFCLGAEAASPNSIAVYDGDSQVTPVGSSLEKPLRVIVKDERSKPIAGAIVDWNVTDTEGQTAVQSSYSNQAGIAETRLSSEVHLGTILVKASLRGTPYYAEFKEYTSPASASIIEIQDGNAQIQSPGKKLDKPFLVVVKDAYGNPIPGVALRWTVVEGNGKLRAFLSSTDSSGRSVMTFVAGTKAGTNKVQASLVNGDAIAVLIATGKTGWTQKIRKLLKKYL